MRVLSRVYRVITGIAAIAVVIGFSSFGGTALAAAPHGVTDHPTIAHPAATPVASPGIYAPPDVVVGEADESVSLPVTLSAPGQGTVTVKYATSDGTAYGEDTACAGGTTAYESQSGTLTFPAGVTTETVQISLLNCGYSLGWGS